MALQPFFEVIKINNIIVEAKEDVIVCLVVWWENDIYCRFNEKAFGGATISRIVNQHYYLSSDNSKLSLVAD